MGKKRIAAYLQDNAPREAKAKPETIKTTVDLAMDFLGAHYNKKAIKLALNGLNLAKLKGTFQQQGKLPKGRDTELIEVATKFGFKPAENNGV